jgi:hypothetical protein
MASRSANVILEHVRGIQSGQTYGLLHDRELLRLFAAATKTPSQHCLEPGTRSCPGSSLPSPGSTV